MKKGLITLWILMGSVWAVAQLQSFYFHSDFFGMPEGLTHGVIADFRADANGMLWIRTVNDLQLFDGKNFIDMKDQVPGDRILGLFNYRLSEDLFFLNNTVLTRLNTTTYLPGSNPSLALPENTDTGYVFILFEDIQFIYITHANDSLYQIDKKKLQITRTYPMSEKVYPNFIPSSIGRMQQPVSSFVFKNANRSFFEFNTSNGKISPRKDIPTNSMSFSMIAKDTLAVLGYEFLYIYTPDSTFEIKLPEPVQNFSGEYLFVDHQDRLLVGLKESIYEFNLRTMDWISSYHNVSSQAMAEIKIRAIEKDKAGNLYIADFNKGLFKFFPRNAGFQFIGTPEGNKFTKNVYVSNQHNLVLMGTFQDGLLLFDTLGHFRQQFLRHKDAPDLWFIHEIIKVSENRFVIFGNKPHELTVAGETYKIREIPYDSKSWRSYYTAPLEFPEWGLYGMNTGSGKVIFTVKDDISLKYIPGPFIRFGEAVTRFKDGILTARKGEIFYSDSTYTTILKRYDLPEFGYTRCMVPYGPEQVLLGTDLGLYLIEVKDSLKIVREIFDKHVYAILPGNTKDEFWFSTDFGLFRFASDFQLTHYAKEIGLQDSEFNTNSSFKSASGKLYFGGVSGITAFFPAEVDENKDPIQAYVSSLSTNQRLLARYITSDTSPHYKLSYQENNIEIELLGKGNKSPSSYHYQYLMEGLSPHWVELKSNSKVNFHLLPGTYTFYYEINNGFNHDAVPKAHFTIVIQPPVYARWWFVTMGIVLGLGVIFFVFMQYKKRQTIRLLFEYKMIENLQKERMRISRELHDNIGAQMATVKRNINFLLSHFDTLEKEQVGTKMKDLENISTKINQELRDTIWATQHEHISVFDFIARLKNYIFQTLGPDSPYRIQYIENCDSSLVLRPFIGLNLHRICQEAINNAIKHAQATELKIAFEGDQQQFKVTITDNGKGFDPEFNHEGFGIKSIRQRAEQMGAFCHVTSKSGEGTAIQISIQKSIIADIT